MDSKKIEKLKYNFNILDTGKTGLLTIDQLKIAFNYCEIDIANDELQALINSKIDSKGNKEKLNYTSFIAAALDNRYLLDKEILWDTFKHFDINNNNYITLEDFKITLDRSCKTKTRENITKMFNEVGIEIDEMIDFNKFCLLMNSPSIQSNVDLKLLSNIQIS